MQKILIIEDNYSIREEIIMVLSFEGFSVIQAENGLSGLQLAKIEQPDIIISDVDMPYLNGFGVLAGVRDDISTTKTPILFITGRSFKEDITKIDKSIGFLLKPFSSEQLLDAIQHLPVCESSLETFCTSSSVS